MQVGLGNQKEPFRGVSLYLRIPHDVACRYMGMVTIKRPGIGPQVLLVVSIYGVPCWVPISDPHPYGNASQRSCCFTNA